MSIFQWAFDRQSTKDFVQNIPLLKSHWCIQNGIIILVCTMGILMLVLLFNHVKKMTPFIPWLVVIYVLLPLSWCSKKAPFIMSFFYLLFALPIGAWKIDLSIFFCPPKKGPNGLSSSYDLFSIYYEIHQTWSNFSRIAVPFFCWLDAGVASFFHNIRFPSFHMLFTILRCCPGLQINPTTCRDQIKSLSHFWRGESKVTRLKSAPFEEWCSLL